jgi:hypothetical protein
MQNADDTLKALDDILMNDDTAKELNFYNICERVFDNLLVGFELVHPTDYFKDKDDNVDLVCLTSDKVHFLMQTLEIFGLPADYLYGNGHHNTWSRDAADGKDKKK